MFILETIFYIPFSAVTSQQSFTLLKMNSLTETETAIQRCFLKEVFLKNAKSLKIICEGNLILVTTACNFTENELLQRYFSRTL